MSLFALITNPANKNSCGAYFFFGTQVYPLFDARGYLLFGAQGYPLFDVWGDLLFGI